MAKTFTQDYLERRKARNVTAPKLEMAPKTPKAIDMVMNPVQQLPKVEIKEPSIFQRALDTIGGALTSTGSQATELGGLALTGLAELNRKKSSTAKAYYQAKESADRYRNLLKEAKTDEDRKKWQSLAERYTKQAEYFKNKMDEAVEYQSALSGAETAYDAADILKESAELDLENAKQGLGIGGQLAVDFASTAIQWAGDAALGAMTGTGALPMMARAAGGGAQQARQDGADAGQQALYALGSGALAGATEKITNFASPLRKVFKKGLLDDAIQKATGKMSGSAAGRMALSFISEGGEEMLESVMQPILQNLTYDAGEKYDAEWLGETLYQGLMGGLLGGVLGGAGEIGTAIKAKNAQKTTGAEMAAMGDDMVRAIIDSGLKMNPESKSYKLAQAADKKVKAGKKLSNAELGKLFIETDREYQRQDKMKNTAEPAAQMQKEEAAGIVLPTAEETAAEDGQGIVLPTGSKAAANTTQAASAESTAQKKRGIVLPTAEETAANTGQGIVLPTAESTEADSAETAVQGDPLEQTAQQYGVDTNTTARVRRISDAIGRKIEFYQDQDTAQHGYYDKSTDTIYINANSRNPVAQIIGHELTHSIEQAGAYGQLQDAVFQEIQRRGTDLGQMRENKRALYARHGVELTDQSAVDSEIVAEFIEKNLLTDEESIRALVRTNRTLAEKIREQIDKLLAKLGNKNAQERDFLNRAKRIYTAALNETAAQTQTETKPEEQTRLSRKQRREQEERRQREQRNERIQEKVRTTGMDKEELKDAYAAGEITEEEFDRAMDNILSDEGEVGAELLGRPVEYSIDENYVRDVDAWDQSGRPDGEVFILGETGDVLQGLGAMEQEIYLRSEKVNAILEKHPEMTMEEIKRIPEILDDPVLVLKSRNAGRNKQKNTRLVLFGTVRAENGQPVMAVLDLRPVEKGLVIDDMQKVTSAYTRNNGANFVQNSDIMYADKKRTIPLLRTIGFQMPTGLLRSGSTGNIADGKSSVNYEYNRSDSSSGRLAHTGPAGLLRSGYIGSITYQNGTVNLEGVPFEQVVETREAGQRQYSFGGENDRRADLDALAQAKEMERQGVAMDTISRITGWYTGEDGKWRFEFDDTKATGANVDTEQAAAYDGERMNDQQGGLNNGQNEYDSQGVPGEDVRRRIERSDTGRTGRSGTGDGRDGTQNEGRRVTEPAAWARRRVIERPSDSAGIAQRNAARYGADAFVVEDSAIKERNTNAWALTSKGNIYISDSIPAELADVVGYHEAVHAAKQKNYAQYLDLLKNTGDYIDFQSNQAKQILDMLLKSRFPGKSLMDLSDAKQETVYDELNALVWGFYKANPENARAQFAEMFRDYDAYIAELDAAMERRAEGWRDPGMLPTAEEYDGSKTTVQQGGRKNGPETERNDGDILQAQVRGAETVDTGRKKADSTENERTGRKPYDGRADERTIQKWARGFLTEQAKTVASERALESVRLYGQEVYLVEDAAIKKRNPNAWALTSGGSVYLSDSIPDGMGEIVGHHEAVRASKQRGNTDYLALLGETSARLNYSSEQAENVLNLLTDTRIPGKQFADLTGAEADVVLDELNALVWGFHKADPENARAQFAEMFRDYDAYIAELDAAMESGAEGWRDPGMLPTAEEIDGGADIRYSVDEEAVQDQERDPGMLPTAEEIDGGENWNKQKKEPEGPFGELDPRETQPEYVAKMKGYPVLDGHQVIPFRTWVYALDRENYGLVVGMREKVTSDEETVLYIDFYNKEEGVRNSVGLPLSELRWTEGKYQPTDAELESLFESEPEKIELEEQTDPREEWKETYEETELKSEQEKEQEQQAAEEMISRFSTKVQTYLQAAERRMVNAIGNALNVPFQAKRDNLQSLAKQISQEYLVNGKIRQKTMDALFEQAYESGRVVDDEFYNQYKDLKDYLRTVPVTISQEDAADIADYNDFRKSTFGRLRITNDGGTPVDIVYEELRTMAPELFPGRITHPADQLVRMFDVAKSIQRSEKNLDEYYGENAQEFKRWAKNEFETAVSNVLPYLRDVKRYAEDRAKKSSFEPSNLTQDEVMRLYEDLKKKRKDQEKAQAKNLLTDEDEKYVNELLRGLITPEALDPEKSNVKGIMQVYKAKQEYEEVARKLRAWNAERRGKLNDQADEILQTANDWKDKRAGILYSREIMERNIEDIVPDRELAKKIIGTYFTPVHKANADAIRLKNRMRGKVRNMDLSQKVTGNNTVSEAHAVQLLGEAEDNIRVLENSRGRTKVRDGRTLEEWKREVEILWHNNPDLDQQKIRNAVGEFRKIYDELFQQMNDARVRNGYEPINYRRGYFPHFQPGNGDGILDAFGRALGISTEVTALPTTINGLTHTFKPGIRYMGNALERLGFNTAYDAVEGFDRYIEGAADVIYHTDNIQRLRALARQARYRTGDDGIRKQVDDVRADPRWTESEKEKRINDIYENGRFTLSNFVLELDEYTNLLANKKSRYDRSMETQAGRRIYNLTKWLENRVAANMVAVNPASWLTNFTPLTQGGAMVGYRELLTGMWDTLKAYKENDGFVDRSTFLTNRRGSDPLVRAWSENMSAIASQPMTWIDSFVADSLVRARYSQNLKNGLSEQAAMDDADSWAARVIADRSKGATPTLFQRSNPLAKLFTQFQLEGNNHLSYLTKDMPREYKEKGKKVLAAALLKIALGAFLFDELFEFFIGRRPSLDPIGILNDTAGDLTGYELPNLVSLGAGLLTGDVPDFETERANGYETVANLTGNILESTPFVGSLLGGGRLPVTNALPGADAAKVFNGELPWNKRISTAAKELGKPLTYLALPFGGGQLKKVFQGVKAVAQGGRYSIDSSGEKILQYPVYNDSITDAVGNLLTGTIFGVTSTEGGKDWIESDFKSLNAAQTETYLAMQELGVDGRTAFDLITTVRDAGKTGEGTTAELKRKALYDSDAPGEAKAAVFYGMLAADSDREVMDQLDDMGADMGSVAYALMKMKDADLLKGAAASNAKRDAIKAAALTDDEKAEIYRQEISDSRDEDIAAFESAGLSFDDFLDAQNAYSSINEEYDSTSQKALELYKWIDQQGFTEEQAAVVKDSMGTMGDRYFGKLVESGLDDETAYKISTELEILEPEYGEDSVSKMQRYKAITESGISDDDQMAALSAVMSESEYSKLQAGYAAGVMPESYVRFKELLPEYDANGSITKEEAEAAIRAIPGLSNAQRAALWQMQNKIWKPSGNPFSTSAGQRVYNDLQSSWGELPTETDASGRIVLPMA